MVVIKNYKHSVEEGINTYFNSYQDQEDNYNFTTSITFINLDNNFEEDIVDQV